MADIIVTEIVNEITVDETTQNITVTQVAEPITVASDTVSTPGPQGDTGAQGEQGEQGITGDNGAGVATGGIDGQTLQKLSAADFDTEWASPVTGVTDHILLTNIGTNTHAEIDTHISDNTVHFTEASLSIPVTGVDFDPVGTDNSDDNAVNTLYASDFRAANFVSGTDYEPAKGVDDNFVTDAEKVVIGNTSNTNSGDQTIPVTGVDFDPVGTDNSDDNAVNTLYSSLVSNATHTGDVTGDTELTIAAKAVDIAMLADGTDGQIISWDASGVATTVGPGTSSQVLTSNGPGAEPTFEDSVSGASNLAELNDVVSATNTDQFALFANGTTGYVGRLIVEDDISDIGTTIVLDSDIGSSVLAEQTIGIANDNLLEVDGTPNSAEYARFTVNGLEGRTEAEFKADYNLETGVDIATNAQGTLADSALQDVSADSTPTLGGNLDVGGNNIVSVSNGDINIIADGTGKTVIPNLEAPTAINTQAGTTYIPLLSDADGWIAMTNAGANTITIPANSGTAFPIGTKLNFEQAGAGATTIAITTDTLNVNANLTLVLNGQYAGATAFKKTATTWILLGNMVAA